MSGSQHLRLLVGKRLAAAAEEIFGLVEKTIAEYQDEVVRSKKEIVQLRQELRQLTVLKSTVVLHRADVPQASLQKCHTKVKQIDSLKDTEIQDHAQVKEEQVDPSTIPDIDAGTSNSMTVTSPQSEQNTDCQLLPKSISVTVSETNTVVEEQNGSNDSSASNQSDGDAAWMQVEPSRDEKSCCGFDIQPSCEELLPSLQQCDSKVEQIYCRETEPQTHMQVKEELVDPSIIPKMEACNSNGVPVGLLQSDPATECQLFPSSSAVTLTVNDAIDDKCVESDGSLSPNQSHSVHMELPSRDDKTCRFCGEVFHRDSDLIRHVDLSHTGQKAFKCLICNKGFGRRDTLVLHVRVHTGEKPYRCDFCGKSFSQSSSRIVHMRLHTGEKPYFCNNCGKMVAHSYHLKICGMTRSQELEEHKEMMANKGIKSFHCTTCGKKFSTASSLKVHMEVHEAWKMHLSEKLCWNR